MHTFAFLAALAAAIDPAAPVSHSMEKIVVTAVASRVAEVAESTPATVTVIERDDLDRALARDIRDALRYEPGISVENGAARFGVGNIAIRGLEGNRVQMLQDGIRLPDGYRVGSFSNASRNPFDLGLLARIEILRGPGSALYGSDALAGVISMTTLAPADLLHGAARFAARVQAGYGEADRSTPRMGAVAAVAGPAQLLFAATRTDARERDNRGEVASTGATRTAPNPQDGHSASQLAKVVVPTADGGRWIAAWERFERRVATDVLSLNPQSVRTVSLAGDDRAERTRVSVERIFHGLGPIDRLSVLAYSQDSGTAQDTVEVRANTTPACLSAPGTVSCRREARFTFDQDEVGVTAIGQTAWSAHQWVYGAEWSRTRSQEMRDGRQTNLATGAVSNTVGTDVFPTRDFPDSRVERLGAFTQDEVYLGMATLIPALRFDRFRMRPEADPIYAAGNPGRVPVAITDDAWSPKLGALVPLAKGLDLTVQAAAGFRAPPYFDVNVGLSNLPLGYTVIANPDLKPEKSRGLEVGLRGRHGGLAWSLTAFRTDYSDLIVSRAPLACPGNPLCVPTAPITFQSQNVTRARIEGAEARIEAPLGAGFTARAGAAWNRGDDRTRGVPLNSVDPAKVVAGLAWEGAAHSHGAELHATWVARKTRLDKSAGTLFATPSYALLDATAYAALGRHVTLHAGIFNLFDRKHWLWSDVRGILNPGASIDRYTQPGRNAGLQIRVNF